MPRRAIPANSPEREAQRAANRAEGRHAAPAHQPEHAAEGPVARWYHILSSKTVFGHSRGERAELTLTDAQASALMAAGHITPADEPTATAPAPVLSFTAVVTPPEETGATPDDNDADNSAE